MYHFLSGYTAKLAGTERGLGSDPQATFSACFGAPFLPRPPLEYAKMLGEKMREHDVKCFLVNTGWVGGAHGAGNRMELKYTRAMVSAAVEGKLDHVPTHPHPVFQVGVPVACPGVPVGDSGCAAANGPMVRRMIVAAEGLEARFRKNFEKFGEAWPGRLSGNRLAVSSFWLGAIKTRNPN